MRIVRDIFEQGWNLQRFESFAEFVADAVTFNFRGGKNSTNLLELIDLVAYWRSAFPDLQFSLVEVLAAGDTVAVNMVFAGTHKGQWQDLPPTGRRIRVEEMMFFRFENGTIIEMWEVYDEFEMRRQLNDTP